MHYFVSITKLELDKYIHLNQTFVTIATPVPSISTVLLPAVI